ncbi:MAG: hypothetical protein LBU88_00645 [Treponema sp.]|jgi:hypothetical protein|nr:hypothetical protein [Treponema sp.]
MMNKQRFLIIILIFLAFPVFAQRLEQRLSWNVENAFRYEIILQRMEAGKFAPYLVESTTVQSLNVSLYPGFYRFLVIPYDVLDRPSKESDWIYFQVVPLHSEEELVEEKAEERIEEKTEEIMVEAEPVDSDMVKRELMEPLIVLHRIAKKRSEEEFVEKIVSERDELKKDWEVFEDIPPLTIRIGVAWTPFILLYGTGFSGLYPLSMDIFASFITKAFGNIYFGTEVVYCRYSLDPLTTPLVDIRYNSDLGINMLVLKWLLGERNAFGVKAGAIFPLQPTGRSVQFNLGMTIYWRLFNKFLLETGFNYSTQGFNGFFRPYIGFSYMF